MGEIFREMTFFVGDSNSSMEILLMISWAKTKNADFSSLL